MRFSWYSHHDLMDEMGGQTTLAKLTLTGYDDKLGRLVDYDVEGQLLSEQSSHADSHVFLVHGPGEFAGIGERCPACRWFEVRIYALEGAEPWAVETVGQTIVPGEIVKRQVWFCDTPRRVVACLVQHRGNDYFLPHTSRRVLDDAAEEDARLAPLVDVILEGDDMRSIA